MKKRAHHIGLLLTAIVMIGLGFFPAAAGNVGASEGKELAFFGKVDPPAHVVLPPQAISNRGRAVSVNARLLAGKRIHLNLFPDTYFVAELKRRANYGNGDVVWSGAIAGEPFSRVTFALRQGVVAGSILRGNALYELNPTPAGGYILFQVNETGLPDDGPSFAPDTALMESLLAADDPSVSGEASPADTICDLMVLYTAASRIEYGQAGIEAKIIAAVEDANQGYQNSQAHIFLNLVHMAEVDYDETGNMIDALYCLQDPSDGCMDAVHQWRNEYGADLVALVDEDSNYCGVGYVMRNPSTSFAPWAFSVTSSGCLSNLTMTHEIGHNQGNMHDRDNSDFEGAYPYSYGFRRCVGDGTGFRTVMSYSNGCVGGFFRINHFSNPALNYNGFTTGIDDELDPVNSADCARSMNNTAPIVAAFRASMTPEPPAAPSDLAAGVVSHERIDLSWTDNAMNEDGFQIERSADGGSWSQVATVMTNITAYSDTGLDPATTYHYRVRAYNGAGNSAYSNTASATTHDPPSPPATPSNLAASALSETEIDLRWTDNSDAEEGFIVERSLGQSVWTEVATLGANATEYQDSGLQPATSYFYRVAAFNAYGISGYSNTASAETFSPPPTVDSLAAGELLGAGSVTGSYGDTHEDDRVTESITEQESGGKPSKRHSYLEHTWRFTNVRSGSLVTVNAIAWGDPGNSEDEFLFSYSTDGGSSWHSLFTVSSTIEGNLQTDFLPATTAGTVLIRVTDSDRNSGNRALDTLHVDQLFIRSDIDPTMTPPDAPSGLKAGSDTAGQVTLTWQDNSSDEDGFEVQRSSDSGETWHSIGSADADAAGYEDAAVNPNTLYSYRVCAFNGAGISGFSNEVSVTTLIPQGIVLFASGYKLRAKAVVDLTWSGADSATVDIYRNGEEIATVYNSGSYPDNTGQKSGSFVYRICDTGTPPTCSNEVTVAF